MCFWSFQTGSWYSPWKDHGYRGCEEAHERTAGLMMTGTEAGELGLDKSMASEKKEEQA